MTSQISEKAMKTIIETMIDTADVQKIRETAQTFDVPTIDLMLKHCQERAGKGTKHGYIHQDLVNLLGEGLGFNVGYGSHTSGYDGLWKYDRLSIIIESKTSTTTYHGALDEALKFVDSEKANCGIIVSGEFNDETINAVAGLKYSNKLRLITTDALCKLALLKGEGVLTTDNVKDILVPQETHILDRVIDLIHGIREQIVKPKLAEVFEEEQAKLTQVPGLIKEYGDESRAMYLTLKEKPNDWFDPSDLAEQIKKTFPKTFAQRTTTQIVWTFPYGGMWLEKKGVIEIRKDTVGRRSYKFKS